MKPDLVQRWGVILLRAVSHQGSRIDTRGFSTRKVDWIKEYTHSYALELNKGRGKRIIKSNWGVFCGSKSYGNEMERLGLWRTEASRSSNSYICLSFFLHSLLVFSPSPQRSAALHTWLNKAGLWESVWMPARSHAAVKRQAFHPSHFWTEFFAPTFFPPPSLFCLIPR